MKTEVKIIGHPHQCEFSDGMMGYIDGYVRGGDDRAYAVVVCGEKIDFVPLYSLRVLNNTIKP
jgi:hypothetical protein